MKTGYFRLADYSEVIRPQLEIPAKPCKHQRCGKFQIKNALGSQARCLASPNLIYLGNAGRGIGSAALYLKLRQGAMNKTNGDRSFTHGGGHALHITRPNVPNCKNAR